MAVSTRVGNLLGATLDDAARTASNVGMLISSSIGTLNGYSYICQVLTQVLYYSLPDIVGDIYSTMILRS